MKNVYQATGACGWKIVAKEALPQGLDDIETCRAFETALEIAIAMPIAKMVSGIALCLVGDRTKEEIISSLDHLIDSWLMSVGAATMAQIVGDVKDNVPKETDELDPGDGRR